MNARETAVVGLAVGTLVSGGAYAVTYTHAGVQNPIPYAVFALAVGAFSLWPDTDMVGTTANTVFGEVSNRLARWTVVPLMGGHRWRSHDILAGPFILGGGLWLAGQHWLTAALACVWSTGLLMAALGRVLGPVTAWLRAVGAVSIGLAVYGAGWSPGWPLAAAAAGSLGVVVHIGTDLGGYLPRPGASWRSWRRPRRY